MTSWEFMPGYGDAPEKKNRLLILNNDRLLVKLELTEEISFGTGALI